MDRNAGKKRESGAQIGLAWSWSKESVWTMNE